MRRVPEPLVPRRSTRFILLLLPIFFFLAGCMTVPQRAQPLPPPRSVPAQQQERGPEVAAALPEAHEAAVEEASIDADAVPDESDVEDEEKTPAPHDDLAVSPPVPSPDEVEKEQELAERQAPLFDIPMIVNDQVTAWVDYYSGPHREKFQASLVRSGRYLPMIQRTFAEAGIPQDLAYVCHVESAFKTTAYSRAKAKGMFQFIQGTGRRYGLRSDPWIDERSDPEKSARAAAAYLKDLYEEFGDWYLALAGYNAGEGRIERALARTGATDFWGIARGTALRVETRNYVPAILAATLIAKDPGKYGFDYVPDTPLEYDTHEVRGAYDLRQLAEAAGLDGDALRQLNPELRRGQTPPGKTTMLRVPPGTGSTVLAALERVPEVKAVASVRHKVQKGETLATIATHYHVSVGAIERANKLGKRTPLQAGRSLVIPTQAVVADWADEGTAAAPRSAAASYRVRSGDTLFAISKRYGTTPAAIAAASGISASNTLQVGQELKIPAAGSKKQASASPVVHTVRPGETLTTIAARYQTSIDLLCQLNDISRKDTLVPGKRLTVRVN